MTQKVLSFARGESGAVTIDYVPFIAMMVGLGVLVASTLLPEADRPDQQTARAISDVDFVDLSLGDSRAVTGDEAAFERVRRNNAGVRPGNGEDGFVPRSAGCASVDTSCSGLGDGTNPGVSSDNNDADGTPGGDGTDNPNQAG